VLVFVLLDAAVFPNVTKVDARLKATWGNRFELTWDEPADRDQCVVQFLHVGENRADIFMMPVPIPLSDLEIPCTTSRFWPEAADVCRTHQAHLVIGWHTQHSESVDQHLLLAQLAAALVQETGALAVYWGGIVVQPVELFCKFADIATREYLPLYMWVDFRVFKQADGRLWGVTTGLDSLGLMEIEGVSRRLTPKELEDKVYDLAHYVCRHGAVLNDGNTVGGDEHERISVRHAASVWPRPGKVVHVNFDGPEKRGLFGSIAGLFRR
jgi:hypothetical protein